MPSITQVIFIWVIVSSCVLPALSTQHLGRGTAMFKTAHASLHLPFLFIQTGFPSISGLALTGKFRSDNSFGSNGVKISRFCQGGDSKESEISRGLVSPAQSTLKKNCTLAQFWLEKSGIRPMPKMGDWFSAFRPFHGSLTWPIAWPVCLSHRNNIIIEFKWG